MGSSQECLDIPGSSEAFISVFQPLFLLVHQVLGTPSLWQWAVFSPGVTSLIYFCSYRWLPETPVSLLKMNRVDEALATLKKLRVGGGEDIELEMLQNELSQQSKSKQFSFVEMMKEPHLRLQFVASALATNCVQFVGVQVRISRSLCQIYSRNFITIIKYLQAVFMYSDSSFIQAGVDSRYVTYATIGLYLQSIPAFALFIPLHRKYGTKRIVIAGLIMCNFGYIIFIICHALHKIISWTSYLAIVGMCIVTFGLQFGPQLCMFSLPSELSTAASRPTIAFYAGILFWILASVTAYVFPFAVASWQSMAYVPFPILGIVLTVVLVYILPETNRRSTAEIQSSFRKKSMVSTMSLRSLRNRLPAV